MIASFFINVRFICQLWLQTLCEFLVIYQVNMNRLLDYIFYTEFKELSDYSGESQLYNHPKRTTFSSKSVEVPLFCKYFRNIVGLFWIYPAAVVEWWILILLGVPTIRDTSTKKNKEILF